MPKKKDTRQLLIESSEFISQIKLSNELKEAVKLSPGKAGTLIVRNIPATICNRPNQNNRIYSTEVIQEAINNAKLAIETKQLLGKPNEHPEGSFIAPSEASHVIINAYIKKNVKYIIEGKEEVNDMLFMDWEILNTQNGKDLRALFEAECSIGTSIRGLGDLEGQYVKNYQLIGIDCVGQPSSSTFTRMPVSESVKVELADPRKLEETFTVTTSSTNVVRDLNAAAQLQAELDNIGYGTVVKTSTKLDSETDPKTGAETTITTLEAETSDDVGELDQALQLARNAMLNGKVSIDSITIENVKEEEPKESVENKEDEKTLNEEEKDPTYLALKKSNYYRFNTPEEYMQFINDNANYLDNGYSLPEAEKIFAEYTDNKISPELACHKLEGFVSNITNKTFEEDEYVPESTLIKEDEDGNIDARETEEKRSSDLRSVLNNIDNYLLKILDSIDVLDPNNRDKRTKVFELWDEVRRARTLSQPFENMDNNQRISEFKRIIDKANQFISEYKNVKMESTMTESKKEEEKDPNEGKKFVLRCKTNGKYIAMNGNAIDFVENPKEAIHFVQGKEESGIVHLSNIKKILDTMGQYEVEKYYRKEQKVTNEGLGSGNPVAGNIKPQNAIIPQKNTNNEILHNDENTSLNEDDSNYKAKIEIQKADGNMETDEIPVASKDLDSMLKEIGNLYAMKSQNANGMLKITVINTTTGEASVYNPETNSFEAAQQVQEDIQNNLDTEKNKDTLQQNNSTLTAKIDNKQEISKEFDSPLQASIAKAGMENGELDADTMLNEDENKDESETIKCAWCGEEFEKSNMKKEKDLGYLCNTCAKGIQSREGKLNFEEDNQPKIKSGWYVSCDGIGVSGPYQSKEEALEGLEGFENVISVDYIDEKDIEETKISEVLYKNPSEPSDPYIDEPLKEERKRFKFYLPDDFDFSPEQLKELENIHDLYIEGRLDDSQAFEALEKINIKNPFAGEMITAWNKALFDEIDELGAAAFEDDEYMVENSSDSDEEISILLGDIDWDINGITSKFMANSQPDDVATHGDLESLINDLPDTLSVKIKANDINMDDPEKIKNTLLDLASDNSGLKINNATILDIK